MDPLTKRMLYALSCLAVPILWGVVIVKVSNAVERRLRKDSDEEIPPIEFYI